MWFQIISELFVNLAAGWFGAVFIEIQISKIQSSADILLLIFKFNIGILSLFIAKFLREKSKRRK